jgi:tetratricopeptide (TPR) repeat protein
MERQSYTRSIKDDPGYVPSLLYLGHNYLESGNYTAALHYYQQALRQDPQIPEAIYNSALAYQKLQKSVDERNAFRTYLDSFRSGKWAHRAVEHLHQLGDFSFRSYRLGDYRMVLNMAALLDANSPEHEQEVAHLSQIIKRTNEQELHLVFFNNSDKTAAKSAAINLRSQLFSHLGVGSSPIRVSWFDSAETILVDEDTKKQLSPSLLIFTKPITNNNRRIST